MVIHKVDGQKVGVLLMQMEFFHFLDRVEKLLEPPATVLPSVDEQ